MSDRLITLHSLRGQIASLFFRPRFADCHHAVERPSHACFQKPDSCVHVTLDGDVMTKKEERGASNAYGAHAEISVYNKLLFAKLAKEYAGKNVLLLNDEDTSKDLRVLNQYHCFRSENCNVEVVEIQRRDHSRLGAIRACMYMVRTAVFFLRCLFIGAAMFDRWRAVTRTHDVGRYRNPFLGRKVFSAFLDLKDYYFGLAFPIASLERQPDVIIANNISSLMFCKAAFGSLNVDLVYDAHELSFMRFRRDMSTLRNWFGFCYEVSLGTRPRHVLTVNRPLGEIYGAILDRDDVAVVCNDLYRDMLVDESQPGESVYMAFFGSARDLRLLHRLAALAKHDDTLNLRFYLIGDEEKQARFIHGLFGTIAPERIRLHFGIGYQQALADEMANGGLWMSWCAIEDACLSYRLSLPNKLIQSIRARMPVIVLEKTYISDVVDAFGVGVSLKLDGRVEEDEEAVRQLRSELPARSSYAALIEQFDLNRI